MPPPAGGAGAGAGASVVTGAGVVVPGAGAAVVPGAAVVVPGAGVPLLSDCAITRVIRPTKTARGEKERATGDIVGWFFVCACVYIADGKIKESKAKLHHS